jgi:hypothetical protein
MLNVVEVGWDFSQQSKEPPGAKVKQLFPSSLTLRQKYARVFWRHDIQQNNNHHNDILQYHK